MASNPVMGAISANGANLANSGSDLSVSTMTNIFGDGWWNLITSSGGGDGILIYQLLEVLNSCCAIVVAWLMIFTVLIASTGTAQEGRSIGGQYASAWVPLRFSFSFAAITPVFNGLCALQILILACIGVSIDLANTMFEKGLEWISEKRTISSVMPSKITSIGQQLAIGAVESQTLINYLVTQSRCEGISGLTLTSKKTGSDTLLLFTLPNNGELKCGGYKLKVKPGALGGFRISNANPVLARKREAAILAMLPETNKLGQQLAAMKPDYEQYNKILNAGRIYSTQSYDAALSDLKTQNDATLQEANKAFTSVAKTQGWFSLGSYYWTLANAAQASMDALFDSTSYIQPQTYLFKNALHTSWGTNVLSNLYALQAAGKNPPEMRQAHQYDAQSMVASDDGIGSIGKFFNDFGSFGEVPVVAATSATGASNNRTAASTVAGWIDGPDAIISCVQLARKVTNTCTGIIIAAEAAKLVAVGAKSASDESFAGKALSTVSFGITSGLAGAGAEAMRDIFLLVLIAMGALWTFATFVAYIVPAMPFLIWVAAIVGWVVLCIEAVVAAPLWLIGHAMPEGAGFAGQHGRTGYMLILSILVRPLLLVLSMFLAMIIMQATGTLLEALFTPFANSMQTFKGFGSGLGPVGSIFLFVLLTGTITLLTWKIFELVTQMPDRIIRWVGQNIQNLGDEGRTATANNVIGSTSRQGAAIQNAGLKMIKRGNWGGKGGTSGGGGGGGGGNSGAGNDGVSSVTSKLGMEEVAPKGRELKNSRTT